MEQIIMALMPELVLATLIGIMLLLDAFLGKKCAWFNYALAIIAMLVASYCAVIFAPDTGFAAMGFIFNKATIVLKITLCVIASAALFYSKQYMQIRGLITGEYLILYLLAVLGMLLLISSNNFLTMYLAIELFSLPLYALIALYHRSHAALEAAVKYFLLSALASAILLYGISLLYGASGEFTFVAVSGVLARLAVFKFSLAFIMVGVFFKLGLIPLHMWLPDVYEGAPTSVTALIATAPKIAVATVVFRFLFTTYIDIIADWQNIIMLIAVLSIGFGNLVAIMQNNIKRMLAYSTIANIGFAILGLLSNEQCGFVAVMFYIVAYAVMYLGVFGVLLLLSKDDTAFTEIADFNGLWARYPKLSIALLLLLFAIVGIPPFAGFCAKFLILKTLLEQGFIGLTILILACSVVGVFYCLRIVKAMFFESAVISPLQQSIPAAGAVLLVGNCVVVALLGLFVAI